METTNNAAHNNRRCIWFGCDWVYSLGNLEDLMKPDIYKENFCGINYECKRGEELNITADADDYALSSWDGVLHLMNKDLYGRTAVFINDLSFFQHTGDKILIKVLPGTPSYIKELFKVRPISKYEREIHNINLLW